MNSMDIETKTLAQSENFLIWSANEPDGETTYYMQINNITVQYFMEEWEDFLRFREILLSAPKAQLGEFAETDLFMASCDKDDSGDLVYTFDLDSASLYLYEEDWNEFCDLIRSL